MKLTKEDIRKYGTEDEYKYLLKEQDYATQNRLLRLINTDWHAFENDYGESLIKNVKLKGNTLEITLERRYDDEEKRYYTDEEMLDQYEYAAEDIKPQLKPGKNKKEIIFIYPVENVSGMRSGNVEAKIKELSSQKDKLDRNIRKLESEKMKIVRELSKYRALSKLRTK